MELCSSSINCRNKSYVICNKYNKYNTYILFKSTLSIITIIHSFTHISPLSPFGSPIARNTITINKRDTYSTPNGDDILLISATIHGGCSLEQMKERFPLGYVLGIQNQHRSLKQSFFALLNNAIPPLLVVISIMERMVIL